MLRINDTVIYGIHGVCKVAGIEEKYFTGKARKYFVLKPVNNDCSTYYVPADNEEVLAKMRKLLSEEEINELIDSMPYENANWIADENERKERYKSIISEGNRTELIKMVKAIFFQKKEKKAEGKRLHSSDEAFLKDAEQLLYGEFRYVLKLNEYELMTYIFERIEKNSESSPSVPNAETVE